MIQDHEAPGDATPSPPGYLQQLADLTADCTSVLELLESEGLQGKLRLETDRPIALRFVRQDVSGDREWCDDDAIAELATRWGYHLALVTIGPGVPTPTLILIQHIRDIDAAAVIVPTEQHIWDSRRAVTELCDLVVADTEEVFKRGHRWPPISTELRSQRPDCTPMWGR